MGEKSHDYPFVRNSGSADGSVMQLIHGPARSHARDACTRGLNVARAHTPAAGTAPPNGTDYGQPMYGGPPGKRPRGAFCRAPDAARQLARPFYPISSRVFFVSEEFFDHQKSRPIVNLYYRTVVVMPDVENQQRPVLVGIRKVQSNLIHLPPNGVAGCLVPSRSFFGRLRVQSRVRSHNASTESGPTLPDTRRRRRAGNRRFRRRWRTRPLRP
jgi:hypothetical protein